MCEIAYWKTSESFLTRPFSGTLVEFNWRITGLMPMYGMLIKMLSDGILYHSHVQKGLTGLGMNVLVNMVVIDAPARLNSVIVNFDGQAPLIMCVTS